MTQVRSYRGQPILRIEKVGSGPAADVVLVLVEADSRGRHKRLQVSQKKLQAGLLAHQPVAP